VAEGCARGLLGLLPRLVQFMVPLLDDPRPLVRSITCWSLSRFSKWLVEAATGAAQGTTPPPGGAPDTMSKEYGQRQLDGVINALLRRILDNNKRVQEASCSAMATLEEQAGAAGELACRAETILQHLMVAFNHYQRKNLRILYDAIGTLADSIGSHLNKPQFMQGLLPPLLAKWDSLGHANRDVFPLMECVGSIINAVGAGFQPFAETVFNRCLILVQHQLQKLQQGGEMEQEFVVVSLDLMCALVEGLGASVEPLVANSQLLDMLLVLCADRSADVRQSAFELLGDLSKVCARHLVPSIEKILSLVQQNLAPEVVMQHENMSACNNACWAAGELVVRMRQEPAPLWPFVPSVVQCLIPLLQDKRLNNSLLENSTITIGRLGLVCPNQVSQLLPQFMLHWCEALRMIRDDKEKNDAFWGLCQLLHVNPSIGLSNFQPLCNAVASWMRFYDSDLMREVGKILSAYKDYMAEDWTRVWKGIDTPVREKLGQMFGL